MRREKLTYRIFLLTEPLNKQPRETFKEEADCLKFIKDHYKDRKDVEMVTEVSYIDEEEEA